MPERLADWLEDVGETAAAAGAIGAAIFFLLGGLKAIWPNQTDVSPVAWAERGVQVGALFGIVARITAQLAGQG